MAYPSRARPELPELPARYRNPGPPRWHGGAKRIAALDGLRGVAIAGVVAFHAGALPGGFLGVDLFFVLSGFFITNLLLKEQRETGNISLSEFWTRRARRLVPALLVLLALAQFWTRTRALPTELAVANGQTVAALLYASNWFNILFDVGYWSVGPDKSPLNHLWSLGIEEQFYILFPPLLFVMASRWNARSITVLRVSLVLAAISFLSAPILFALLGADRAYFGTDSRVGAILLGVAFSAWLAGQREPTGIADVAQTQAGASVHAAGNSAGPRALTIAGGAGVAVLIILWAVSNSASPLLYRGGLLLHALASVSIIAAVVLSPAGLFATLLQWRPLVWLGERSYSLYLWHWPLMVVLPSVTGLKGYALFAVVTFSVVVATIISYELVEHPIRYGHLRGTRLVASLSLPAFAIASSALLWQPPEPPQFGTDTLVTTGRGRIRLMVVGDSWARKLGIALAELDSTHQMSILNIGKGGCGIADAKRQRTPAKGEFETSLDCLQWHNTWRSTLDAIRPEVAILNVGNWDQAPQDFDGTGKFVGACTASFGTRYSQQLDTAITLLKSRAARVFVMTVFDNDEREGSIPDCMNALLRNAVSRHASEGVQLLDLYAQLCSDHRCPQVVDNEPVYDETGHLAPRAQRRIATWVMNTVNESLVRR